MHEGPRTKYPLGAHNVSYDAPTVELPVMAMVPEPAAHEVSVMTDEALAAIADPHERARARIARHDAEQAERRKAQGVLDPPSESIQDVMRALSDQYAADRTGEVPTIHFDASTAAADTALQRLASLAAAHATAVGRVAS